ncbi:MAG: hypothetical protein U0Q15_09455 [Kineosporiaceae bacterium]
MGGKGKRGGGLKPKKKCCESKPRCTRCPLRMLAEGTLPEGYTVRHRKLVKAGPAAAGTPGRAKDGKVAKGDRPSKGKKHGKKG